MANPQLENGHTRIANELLEALARAPVCGAGFRIVMCIIRKTYGWQKTASRITQAQMAAATGMDPRNLNRELRLLIERRIILRQNEFYALNKNYDDWDRFRPPRSKRSLVTKLDIIPDVAPAIVTSDGANSSLLTVPQVTSDVADGVTSDVHKKKKETTSNKSSKIGAPSAVASAVAIPKPPSDHQLAIDFWCTEYKAAFELDYAFSAKDGKMIKELLRTFGLTRLRALMLELLHTEDHWLRHERGIQISTLWSERNVLAQKALLDRKTAPTPQSASERASKTAIERFLNQPNKSRENSNAST